MIAVGIMFQPGEEAKAWQNAYELTIAGFAVVPLMVPTGSNQAENRQRLVARAHTKYFTWLDPDDYLDPAFLLTAVDMMEADSELGMVQGIEEEVENGQLLGSTKGRPVPSLVELALDPMAYHNGVVFRTEYLQEFSHQLPAEKFYSLDHVFRLVMAVRWRYARVDEPGYRWVQHKDQHHRKRLADIGDLIPPIKALEWIIENKPELLRTK